MHTSRLPLLALIWLALLLAGGVLPLCAQEAPMPAAVAQLADDNPLVRAKAAEALGGSGDRRVVPQLIAVLTDEFSVVRGAAATALGKLHDKQALAALIALVQDPDTGIEIRAVEALGNLGDVGAVGALTAALQPSHTPILRTAAVTALSKIPAPQSGAALLGALTDPAASVRIAAITALVQLHNQAAGKALAACLQDTDPGVRATAVTALGNLRDPSAFAALAARQRDGDASVQIAAITALSKLPEPKVIPLLLPLVNTGDNMDIRLAAAGGLGRLRAPQAIPELLTLLNAIDRDTQDSSPDKKIVKLNRVASALQRIGEPTMRAALAAFRDCHTAPADEQHVRQNLQALQNWGHVLDNGWCQSREMKQALVDLLATPQYAVASRQLLYPWRSWRLVDPVAGVMTDNNFELIAVYLPLLQREGWLNELNGNGARQTVETIDPFLAGLKDPNPETRKRNATTLGNLGDGRAVPALLDLLQNDTDAGVREYVALALGEIGDERAVMPLCERIKVDTTEWSRSAAAWALGKIGDPRAADTLAALLPEQNPRFQVRAARSLLQLGDDRGSETLAALAGSPDQMVNEIACHGFSTLHRAQPAAVPVLLDQLAKATDAGAQNKLLSALATVADPTTAEPMWEFLQTHDDPMLNALAARALANAGNPALADALYQVTLDALDDESRTAAALGLLKLHDPRATDLLLDFAKAPFGLGRNSAIYALASVNDPRVADTCALLLEDDDPLARALAARVLVLRHDARGVPVLLALLHEGTEEVSRLAAAHFLGEAKVMASVTPLCAALKTATPAERAAFAEALGALGDPAAIPALKDCRQDNISRVSQAAAKALKKMGVAE